MTSIDRRSFLGMCGALALGGVGACSTSQVGHTTRGTAVITVTTPTTVVGERRTIRSAQMVGDSLLRASTDAVTTTFNGVGISEVTIDGKTGRRIEVGNGLGEAPLSGIRTVQALLAAGAKPDVWIIVLGTNDIGSYSKVEQFAALIDEMILLLPSTTPLIWMNVYRQQYPEISVRFNTALQQRIGARGNALVADWYSLASAPKQDVLRTDGIHPNVKGSQQIALLLLQALQRL